MQVVMVAEPRPAPAERADAAVRAAARADAAPGRGVTHGGHNTVCEALAHGLPLVVAPIRDDQPTVAAQVVQAGAGVRTDLLAGASGGHPQRTGVRAGRAGVRGRRRAGARVVHGGRRRSDRSRPTGKGGGRVIPGPRAGGAGRPVGRAAPAFPRVQAASARPGASEHSLLTATGVHPEGSWEIGDADLVDLVPRDLPTVAALDLLGSLDPAKYRATGGRAASARRRPCWCARTYVGRDRPATTRRSSCRSCVASRTTCAPRSTSRSHRG